MKDPSAVPPETYPDARGIDRVAPTNHAHPSLQRQPKEPDGRTPEERALGIAAPEDREVTEIPAVSTPVVGGSASAAAAHSAEQDSAAVEPEAQEPVAPVVPAPGGPGILDGSAATAGSSVPAPLIPPARTEG